MTTKCRHLCIQIDPHGDQKQEINFVWPNAPLLVQKDTLRLKTWSSVASYPGSSPINVERSLGTRLVLSTQETGG